MFVFVQSIAMRARTIDAITALVMNVSEKRNVCVCEMLQLLWKCKNYAANETFQRLINKNNIMQLQTEILKIEF